MQAGSGNLKVDDFAYSLPEELIAQDPAPSRDISRLMVLEKAGRRTEHRIFRDIKEYLKPGDVLVLNETRVLPARLLGHRQGSGGAVEVLLLNCLGDNRWEALVKPGRKIREENILTFGGGLLEARVVKRTDAGGRVLEFTPREGTFEELLHRLGALPLPPYIKKAPRDPGRYQTVYARQEGSAAAPTAGLHFTTALLDEIRQSGVKTVNVLLHIGLGTFRPVQAEEVEDHLMHSEYYELSPGAAEVINGAASGAGRVIAVGTTSARCLESAAVAPGVVRPGRGWTDIFIYPGYNFKVVEGLLTNFHLPRSTLIMMVAALAGRERTLEVYRTAVEMKYRFFSFGDAMLII